MEIVHDLFRLGDRMRLKFELLAEGPGPSETMIGIRTVEGKNEEVVISKKSVSGQGVEVGTPLQQDAERLLVELPRESLSGRWRIWVPRSEALPDPSLEAAE